MSNFECIQKGSKGDRVNEIQNDLNKWGFPLEGKELLKVDGDFGDKTDNAVRQFQKNCGLKVDGIVGEKTYKILSQASNPSIKVLVDILNQQNVSQLMRLRILYQLTEITPEDNDLLKVFANDKVKVLLIEDSKSADSKIRNLATKAAQSLEEKGRIMNIQELTYTKQVTYPSLNGAPLESWRKAIIRWLAMHMK